MTVNDYLARRDAAWMGGIYRFLGLSVAHVQQGMTKGNRRKAYACDITYGTANEIGFDFLRDRLALHVHEQVHRPFAAAVIDEADSILIDEARVPLVIAGGSHRRRRYRLRSGPGGPRLPALCALQHRRCQPQRCFDRHRNPRGGRRLRLRQSL